ncbi:Uncharacterised protein [Klebsiella pneumoniae]|nr:Uncharacterised protein [Klebsiella pneumoniae]SMA48382.1 Uncharacterised protein [Klebsiella pneumoniae]
MRAEQRNILVAYQAAIHKAVDHYAIVQMTNTVLLDATVILQHQQTFNFQMPNRVESRRGAAANATLRA